MNEVYVVTYVYSDEGDPNCDVWLFSELTKAEEWTQSIMKDPDGDFHWTKYGRGWIDDSSDYPAYIHINKKVVK